MRPEAIRITSAAGPPRRVTVAGEIDFHTAPDVAAALAEVDAGAAVELDLAEVTYLDSAALNVLIASSHRQRDGGGRLRIVRPSHTVRRLLDLTGLTGHLDVEP